MQKPTQMAGQRLLSLLVAMFAYVSLRAQEEGLDINVDIDGGGEAVWYTNPWIWVGVAAFVIILVLAMRGRQ